MRVLRPRRLARLLIGGVVALLILVAGGTWLYIHVIEGPAPAPLSLRAGSAASRSAAAGSGVAGSASTSVAGDWQVAAGSVVGYRVNEVLAGQNNIAVGRTGQVSGSMTIQGGSVTAASFTVQMATIHSDESERDAQFDGRIMDTAAYPTGTLKLTAPITLTSVPAEGVIGSYQATGNLTLHGSTRSVTFTLQAERTSAGLEVSGSIPIVFADWGIGNPDFAGFVTTQNHGLLEFLINFSRA